MMIKNSEKPFILVGGGANLADAADEVRLFAQKVHAPVGDTLMGNGAMRERA